MFLSNKLAGSGSVAKTYVDDVFATSLYTGNGTSLSINNGIDLAGKGGMVLSRSRQTPSGYAADGLTARDSARGISNVMSTNQTDFQITDSNGITSFNSNGFSIGSGSYNSKTTNVNGGTYVAYTFRKAPKFFDVVTYTGNGASGRQITHALGVVPGLVIVKKTDGSTDWFCSHKSLVNNNVLTLNGTSGEIADSGGFWFGTHTSESFTVGTGSQTNATGGAFVAYVFADDTSPDGLIRCGSYIGNGSTTGTIVNLGWEPQWLMVKNASGTGSWHIIDNQRGFTFDGLNQTIQVNSSAVEAAQTYIGIRSNGFQVVSTSSEVNTSGATYIYMAIRRSNKPPTSGTEVFSLQSNVASSGYAAFGVNTPASKIDLLLHANRSGSSNNFQFADRVRGFRDISPSYPTNTPTLSSSSNAAEYTATAVIYQRSNLAGSPAFIALQEVASSNHIDFGIKRAVGFFDVVAYKSAGAGTVVKHNLGVIPQLVIIKSTKAAGDWAVGHNIDGLVYWSGSRRGALNSAGTLSANTSTFNPATATEVTPSQGSEYIVDKEYIMYLFATLPGISKVGIYTGNGSAMTINCGFVAGARFVMIKRTDAVGDWCVFDTVRGITDEYTNDPVILMNSSAAETSVASQLYAQATGFNIQQNTANNLNVLDATYIFLAIA